VYVGEVPNVNGLTDLSNCMCSGVIRSIGRQRQSNNRTILVTSIGSFDFPNEFTISSIDQVYIPSTAKHVINIITVSNINRKNATFVYRASNKRDYSTLNSPFFLHFLLHPKHTFSKRGRACRGSYRESHIYRNTYIRIYILYIYELAKKIPSFCDIKFS